MNPLGGVDFSYLLKAPHFGFLRAVDATTSSPSLLPPEPTSLATGRPVTSGKMSGCGRKALTLLSSVFAVCGLGLLGIAVSTDYWLYLEEGVVLPQNQSMELKMSLHSGLWRVCFLAGKGTPGWASPAPERERSSPCPLENPLKNLLVGKRCSHSKGAVHQGYGPWEF